MAELIEHPDKPEEVHEITSFQQNILAVLAEEERYGLAVKEELEGYYGSEINHGRLYTNLDDLAEMGFVEKSKIDDRTNTYKLTDAGREAILHQLDWEIAKYVQDRDLKSDVQDLIEAYS